MSSISTLLLKILRTAINEDQVCNDLKSMITVRCVNDLYKIAKAHDVVQIVADVLNKNGLLNNVDEDIKEKYSKSQLNALYRYMKIDHEQQAIYSAFEAAQIPFVPLKGAVIREYYPEPYLRTSCDIDILVDESNLRKAEECLVTQLKYVSNETVDFHDLSLFSPGGVHLELHYNLKEKRENLDKLLSRVWEFCVDTDKGQYYKLQTPEFFVFHHLAHMVNHFLRGGCGIRTFIDYYYIKHSMTYDPIAVRKMCRDCEIDTFYDAVDNCVDVWFGDKKPDEISTLMENFIIRGGVYGTKENRVNVDRHQSGGKTSYLLSRIFMPYDLLKYKFPVLQKHKYLLPVMQIFRLLQLLSPQKRQRAKKELEIHKNISETGEDNISKMMEILKI